MKNEETYKSRVYTDRPAYAYKKQRMEEERKKISMPAVGRTDDDGGLMWTI